MTAWKDRHSTDDGVKILSNQGWDGLAPIRPHEFNLEPDIPGELIRDIDLEADQLAVHIAQ